MRRLLEKINIIWKKTLKGKCKILLYSFRPTGAGAFFIVYIFRVYFSHSASLHCYGRADLTSAPVGRNKCANLFKKEKSHICILKIKKVNYTQLLEN